MAGLGGLTEMSMFRYGAEVFKLFNRGIHGENTNR